MQERKERIAKREAFIEQKAKDYSQLIQLKAFDGYLVGQSQEPDVEAVASIGRVAQELVDRLKHALSVPELNQEIDRSGSIQQTTTDRPTAATAFIQAA